MLAAETQAGRLGAAAGCWSSGFQNPTRTFLVALQLRERGSLLELLIKPATAAQRSVAPQKPSYHFPRTHASARCDLTRATRKTKDLRSLAKTMADDQHPAVSQYVEGLQTLLEKFQKDNAVAGDLWSQLKDAHQEFYYDNMLHPSDDDVQTRVSDSKPGNDSTHVSESKMADPPDDVKKHNHAVQDLECNVYAPMMGLLFDSKPSVDCIKENYEELETAAKDTTYGAATKDMIKAGIQNMIYKHQDQLHKIRETYCELKYKEQKLLSQCRCEDTKDDGFETEDGFKYMQLPRLEKASPVSLHGRRHKLHADATLTEWRVLWAAFDAYYFDNKDDIEARIEKVNHTPKKPRLNPPAPQTTGGGKGMFKKDERVEVESSNGDKPIKWWKATIVTTKCPNKTSHYKVLYDEPEDDPEEDRLEEVPVRRISKWGEAGQKRRDEYVRKDPSGREF